MDSTTVSELLTLLFGTGFLGVVVKLFFDRRKTPLDRAQVLSSIASQNLEDALAIATAAGAAAKEAKAEAKEACERAKRAEQEVRSLSEWAADIVRNWATVRASDIPPDLPPEARHYRRYST